MRRRDVLALGLRAPVGALAALAPAARPVEISGPSDPAGDPIPPGGVYDATGRPWADKVKPILGTIVVENIGGAGSSRTAAVARAKPDGYTILLGGKGSRDQPIATRAPYDPVKDFEPIAILGVTAPPSRCIRRSRSQTLNELIAYAKANPGKLSYGSSGVGTVNHLIGELFKSLTGADIAHVPYRGAGPR